MAGHHRLFWRVVVRTAQPVVAARGGGHRDDPLGVQAEDRGHGAVPRHGILHQLASLPNQAERIAEPRAPAATRGSTRRGWPPRADSPRSPALGRWRSTRRGSPAGCLPSAAADPRDPRSRASTALHATPRHPPRRPRARRRRRRTNPSPCPLSASPALETRRRSFPSAQPSWSYCWSSATLAPIFWCSAAAENSTARRTAFITALAFELPWPMKQPP